jgi:4-amino-4-deoxy-L-arabinose transferase-like glycosyltransferase
MQEGIRRIWVVLSLIGAVVVAASLYFLHPSLWSNPPEPSQSAAEQDAILYARYANTSNFNARDYGATKSVLEALYPTDTSFGFGLAFRRSEPQASCPSKDLRIRAS